MHTDGGFDAFYVRRFEQVVRAVLALTDSREEAFDIAQEAFVRAWQRWQSFATDEQGLYFTLRVATNIANSRLRRLIRLRHLLPRLASTPVDARDPAANIEGRDEVQRLLASLPRQQRRIVVMCDGLDLTPNDVAEVLRISPSTVRVHLSRAHRRMRATVHQRD